MEPPDLGNGLSLLPRLRISLSFRRADLSLSPIDEWQLKESLIAFVQRDFAVAISEQDLTVRKERDLHKKRRGEPVASGQLYIWDLEGLMAGKDGGRSGGLERKKGLLLQRFDGMEVHFGGMKLRCEAWFEDMEDFESMRSSWQGIVKGPVGADHCTRKGGWQPDTLFVKRLPSRWLAEPRVSSKASILVTHTVFSKFGAVRNLDVKEDLDVGMNVPAALNCQVWIQYEQHSGFLNAMKAFCGCSMQRVGSSLKANYDVSWDKDGYFLETNLRKRRYEKDRLEEQHQRKLALKIQQEEIAIQQASSILYEQQMWENGQSEQREKEENERRDRERDHRRIEEAKRKEEFHKLEEEFPTRNKGDLITFRRQKEMKEVQEELLDAKGEQHTNNDFFKEDEQKNVERRHFREERVPRMIKVDTYYEHSGNSDQFLDTEQFKAPTNQFHDSGKPLLADRSFGSERWRLAGISENSKPLGKDNEVDEKPKSCAVNKRLHSIVVDMH